MRASTPGVSSELPKSLRRSKYFEDGSGKLAFTNNLPLIVMTTAKIYQYAKHFTTLKIKHFDKLSQGTVVTLYLERFAESSPIPKEIRDLCRNIRRKRAVIVEEKCCGHHGYMH